MNNINEVELESQEELDEITDSINDMFVKILGRNINLDDYLLLCSHDKKYVDELLKILKLRDWRQIVDLELYKYVIMNCRKWHEAFAISIDTYRISRVIENIYNNKFKKN